MSEITPREELNTYDFDTLVGLVITMQHQGADREALVTELETLITELKEENRELKQQNKEINEKLQLLIEQIAISNRGCFDRSSEKPRFFEKDLP